MSNELRMAAQSAVVLGDILYIKIPRSKVTPKDIAVILEEKHCNMVCFNNAKRMYSLFRLKGKEDWKDVN